MKEGRRSIEQLLDDFKVQEQYVSDIENGDIAVTLAQINQAYEELNGLRDQLKAVGVDPICGTCGFSVPGCACDLDDMR